MSGSLDRELLDCSDELRWRIWMGRVEATIFASPVPVRREHLQDIIGHTCQLDQVMASIGEELKLRPYEIVEVAGGFQMRTRPEFADAIKASNVLGSPKPDLTKRDLTVLMAIAYFQPITRVDLASILGKSISRDAIANLSRRGFVAAGHRSPLPGAPYNYITTDRFLLEFGFRSLRELPDMDKLSETGLLDRNRLWAEPDPATLFHSSDDSDIEDVVI